ncbi:MAG: GDP-mannose 4,6-dehydratase [Acidobacteria bacterium]|nr:GDP-mannose 4,6-dehydratase [Acidobacteriota bacterium]
MLTLVTGCAGFIGSHLAERLLAAGHEVIGVDALTDYYDPELKRDNLRVCLDHRLFRYIEAPVASLDLRVVREAEVIYHLAGQPGVRASWRDGFQACVAHNILSTQCLLEQARESKNLRRLVYASSSSVYGNITAERVTEEHPKKPYSPYGVTKLAAEQLCSLYADNFGVPAVSLRLFTVCGPRQRPDMMFHRLIGAALKGVRFQVFGDGGMVRDFTCVFDVVEALILAAEGAVRQGVFNIAGGQVASVREVIALVGDLLGSEVPVEYQGEQQGDVRRTCADIAAASKQLNYRPEWKLRDGLRLQINSIQELLAQRTQVAGAAL